jgi:hypothetical protein
VLGALGLILPRALNIAPVLTPNWAYRKDVAVLSLLE